jgi:hypothetical protein
MKLNTVFRKLLLLAPAGARIPESLDQDRVSCNARRHEDYLDDVQRLRGRIYLEDGAIREGDLLDGRHVVESDSASWHLLVLDHEGRTCGCVRYRDHGGPVGFSELTAARSSLASCPEWGARMRTAVEEELLLSEALELPFVEIGGWALDDGIRGTVEALRMVLGAYAFAREFGGAVGLATATVRHSSASILRRIGGQPLEHLGKTVPPYADRQYNCQMELLRFHSWALNPRYDPWISQMTEEIRGIAVISAGSPVEHRRSEHKASKFVDRIREAVRGPRAFRYPLPTIAQPALE